MQLMATASFNRRVSVCRSTFAKVTLLEEFAQEVVILQWKDARMDFSKTKNEVSPADSYNRPQLRPRSQCQSKDRRAVNRGSHRRHPDSKQNGKRVANQQADQRHREPAFP